MIPKTDLNVQVSDWELHGDLGLSVLYFFTHVLMLFMTFAIRQCCQALRKSGSFSLCVYESTFVFGDECNLHPSLLFQMIEKTLTAINCPLLLSHHCACVCFVTRRNERHYDHCQRATRRTANINEHLPRRRRRTTFGSISQTLIDLKEKQVTSFHWMTVYSSVP